MNKLMLLLLLISVSASAYTQDSKNFMQSTDDEFTMQLSKDRNGVSVMLRFSDISKYNYVTVERSVNPQYNFSRCKYLDLEKLNIADGKIVAVDNYPLPASEDAFYRVRAFTKDGGEIIYPSTQLYLNSR